MNKIHDKIRVIAFDADDTLWVNEQFYRSVERQYAELLSEWGTVDEISKALFAVEMSNMELLGYGAKAFTISLIENALRVSNGNVSSHVIGQIVRLGKSLLEHPVLLLPGVQETLETLKHQRSYRLVVATKGDILDQQRKLRDSSLSHYFDHVEIMANKTEYEYESLLKTLQVAPNQFVMIGNSLKSDVLPVLNIGGSAVHIPSAMTWQHEVIDHFNHPNLTHISQMTELLELF